MYSPSAAANSANTTEFGTRMFVYEVVGLRQNLQTDLVNYPIRQSGSVFITVPYSRMNQEMQRITHMGGKIVSIQPLYTDNGANGKAASNAKPKAEQQQTQSEKKGKPSQKRKANQ